MGNYVSIPEKKIPVVIDVDVLVCGGGPAGIGAAVGAAMQGASVAIVERFGCLGGLMTSGLITDSMSASVYSGDKILIRGVWEKLFDRMVDHGTAIRGYELIYSNKFFPFDRSRCEKDHQISLYDVEAVKITADELMEEYGINVLYFTSVTDTIVENQTIKGVIIESKAGMQAIIAKRVIDCTGDAEVAIDTGIKCIGTMGEDMHHKGPLTLLFRVGGVEDVVDSYKPDVKEIPYGAINLFPLLRPREFRIEMTRYIGSALNREDMTKAMIECRKQIPQIIEYLRKNLSGCKEMYLIDSATVAGSLAHPKIVGEYSLSSDDVLNHKVTEDVVALSAYGVDVHSDEEGGQNELHWLEPGTYYGFPYRCLVPKSRIDNLLVAGKIADIETGCMPVGLCVATGEAAGTASALSIKEGVTPRNIKIKTLQKQLVDQGVLLEPEQVPKKELNIYYNYGEFYLE